MSTDDRDAKPENEKRLLALLAAELPSSSFLLDGERRVLAHTRVDARLASGAPLVGTPLVEAIAHLVVRRTNLAALLDDAARTRAERSSPCVPVALASGTRNLRVRVAVVSDGEAQFLVLIEDVTELIDAETHATRLASMAGAVAHEIRNPLAGISGTLQVLSSALDVSKREIVEKAQAQIRRVDTLIQELLAFARPIAPALEEVDLSQVATRAVSTAEARGLAATEITGAGRGLADGGLLASVIASLLENASEAGATRARIEVGDAEVRVLDDGPGIPEADRARIFEPFFTTRTRGTGLGLPMARKTIEAMGGDLSLCDSPLGGAGLKLTLSPAP